MLKIIKIILLIICGNVNAGMIPEDGDTFNYRQLFFRWDQIPNVEYYILSIQNIANSNEQIEIQTIKNSYLTPDFLQWNSEYIWNVCSVFNDQEDPFCTELLTFSINPLPDYFPDTMEISNLDESLSQEGITLMDFESSKCSGGINTNGDLIWFVEKDNFNQKFTFTQFLDNGNVIGFDIGTGYEIDLNGNIIFETPSQYNLHHQIHKTSKNTYFIISAIIENHTCPEECNDFLPNEIPWQGDVFRELDIQGNEIWSWNTFDYFELTEYNPYYVEIYTGHEEMDWTHSNSIFFDQNSESVFISVRNLSRITKIDYKSKNLVWNLGESDFMEEIYFENNLNFSQQHSAQILENGNILFFDNHRYLTPELSRCIEVEYDEQNSTAEIVWEHTLPAELFTGSRGECDRLENGNTLITVGRTGNILEVTSDNDIVWQLEVSNLGNNVTMYRSSRITHLFPIAFSITINEIEGDINNPHITPENGLITANIHNSGWNSGWFTFSLQDIHSAHNIIDSIYVSGDLNLTFPINIVNLPSSTYDFSIYPHNASEKIQSMSFEIINSILGDINNDETVNVLDVVNLVNLILANDNSNSTGDINQDGNQNIFDIVLLISIILER